MKRHLKIISLIFQHVLNYRARNLVWFIESMITPLILLLFWQGAVSEGTKINNWTVNDIRSYYLYIMVASVFLMHSVELIVSNNEIKNGELEPHLLKPFPYSLFRFYSEAPWRFIQFFYAMAALFLFTFLFRLDISHITEPAHIAIAVVVAIMAYILSYLFKIVLAFITFWITDIRSILEINEVFIILFAGHILPIPFMPQWLQTIANLSPYPYIIYYPAAAFAGLLTPIESLNVIFTQLLMIGFFALIYKVLWNKGLRIFTGLGQ